MAIVLIALLPRSRRDPGAVHVATPGSPRYCRTMGIWTLILMMFKMNHTIDSDLLNIGNIGIPLIMQNERECIIFRIMAIVLIALLPGSRRDPGPVTSRPWDLLDIV